MDIAILMPEEIGFYLDGFKKTQYAACFQHYCQITQPVWEEIAYRGPEECAAALADWIDAHPGRFFKARRMADRQMLMLQYTAPAAVKMGQQDFAEALSRVWNRRHPKYPFRVASYEALMKGFNNTLLGFPLPKKED